MSPEAKASFENIVAPVRETLAELPKRDRAIFELRLAHSWQDLFDGLTPPYAGREDFEPFLEKLVSLLACSYVARSEELKMLDLRRSLDTGWFQSERLVGYVFYVDRFAKDLKGVRDHLDYLRDIGAGYIHLMPLLQTRPEPNDGGYAVMDYRMVEPELGTMDDLEALCSELRGEGVSVCLDLVLNHCAREHDWAKKARSGDLEYLKMFHTFPDRTIPDEYEKHLPEVFPETAPGNFTFDEKLGRWVWTTFHDYQWDLAWSEPHVFLEMTDTLLSLANRGVEVFRLDAVAFLWKRLGTDCQNQPEAHDLLQALRACSRIVAPAVAHKAEAIVAPHDLIQYLGTNSRYGKESDLAYHNSLMVQFWSTLATRDTTLMTRTLTKFPEKPANTAWGLYVRGHDDIGWAITGEDAADAGLDGFAHREFLSDYYTGGFPDSQARGEVYQLNPATADRRISGTTASLAGLEYALEFEDETLIDLAIKRILLGHALILGYGGIPLIFMGDELALRNDPSYLDEPDKKTDSRWLHRPKMDWRTADRRKQPGTLEAQVFRGVSELIAARKRTPHLHAATPTRILDAYSNRVFAFARPHPLGTLVAVHNFTEDEQRFQTDLARAEGIYNLYDAISERRIRVETGDMIELAPYQSVWILDRP